MSLRGMNYGFYRPPPLLPLPRLATPPPPRHPTATGRLELGMNGRVGRAAEHAAAALLHFAGDDEHVFRTSAADLVFFLSLRPEMTSTGDVVASTTQMVPGRCGSAERRPPGAVDRCRPPPLPLRRSARAWEGSSRKQQRPCSHAHPATCSGLRSSAAAFGTMSTSLMIGLERDIGRGKAGVSGAVVGRTDGVGTTFCVIVA
jgi:hypothetical protein